MLGRVFVLLCLATPSLLSAIGLLVYPMQQQVKPGESAVYIASNQSDKAIAVEVIPEKWSIDEDGNETREPTKDLVAFPSQFILKGNTYKKIKVGHREQEEASANEASYRVTIRELPISLDPEEPGSYRIYHASGYRTSFYVSPGDARPEIKLVTAARAGSKLTLRFENSGAAHVHLRNPRLAYVNAEGKQLAVVEGESLAPINGHNMHAGKARKFELPIPEGGIPEGTTGVRLLFEDNGPLQQGVYEVPLSPEL